MKIRTLVAGTMFGLMILMFQSTTAVAAEIKIIATHAVMEVLTELGPQFERATGHKLIYSYDPSGAVKRQIEQGVVFDVAIITTKALEDLAKQKKINAVTITNIGRSGLGVAVRKGAPKPDISTVENFRKALLAAKSVVRSTEGASGLYFAELMTRLGIADQMKDKLRLGPSGRISELVADGKVEMAVQQISEILPVAGAQFVGPFPAEIQLYTTFAAGISTDTKQQAAARALIAFLKTPAAIAVIKSHGLEPVK
jgi:molybdate transport system substrate-binding protein